LLSGWQRGMWEISLGVERVSFVHCFWESFSLGGESSAEVNDEIPRQNFPSLCVISQTRRAFVRSQCIFTGRWTRFACIRQVSMCSHDCIWWLCSSRIVLREHKRRNCSKKLQFHLKSSSSPAQQVSIVMHVKECGFNGIVRRRRFCDEIWSLGCQKRKLLRIKPQYLWHSSMCCSNDELDSRAISQEYLYAPVCFFCIYSFSFLPLSTILSFTRCSVNCCNPKNPKTSLHN
jgi:hypothetical protein